MRKLVIGDCPVSIEECINVSNNKCCVEISANARERIINARNYVNQLTEENRIIYGLTTGFGSLSNKFIRKEDTKQLQLNLIRSHAVGIGKPIKPHLVRCMFLIRLICICNGNSGVRIQVADKIIEALNKNFIPEVPKKGTVGASGDLAPLSHLILGLLGEGKAYDFKTEKYIDAKIVMNSLEINSINLMEKEGLALNNGTQFITSHAIFAWYNAMIAFKNSNMIAAMSLEALHGTHRSFNNLIHQAKPHSGQCFVANDINNYILENGEPSNINKTHASTKVQDGYDLRAIPQVHGPLYDLLIFSKKIIETELNSSNDNPLIFSDKQEVLSGANFHGMYIAMIADQIAYAMSILCNISERRLDRMLNPSLNGFLPEFLIEGAGLNSGFMIVQYTSAALTSENRHLANPGSVGNIPTCNGCESIVSMGGWPARKAIKSVKNTFDVLALELFTACQALDYTKEKSTTKLQQIYDLIRKKVPHIKSDVYMKEYIDTISDMLQKDIFLNSNNNF